MCHLNVEKDHRGLLSTLRLLSIVFKYAFRRKVETVDFLEVVVSEKQETAWLYTISKTGRVTDSVLGPTAKIRHSGHTSKWKRP